MKRLAVIPARGGSTRLKNKNLYPLGGQPLIKWITQAVIESNQFDEIVISTDNPNIYHMVSNWGVKFHIRPDELATTEATVLDAMLDLMNNWDFTNEPYDTFSYFLPTCPFISYKDIIDGVRLLESQDEYGYDIFDTVVSMTKMDTPIQLACLMSDGNVLPVFDNLECGLTNSKFIKEYYKPSGGFYMGFWNKILENRNFFKGNAGGVCIPKERSVDINTVEDIKYAEAML